jgi:hypothetical protein
MRDLSHDILLILLSLLLFSTGFLFFRSRTVERNLYQKINDLEQSPDCPSCEIRIEADAAQREHERITELYGKQ